MALSGTFAMLKGRLGAVPRGVIMLGFVSMFMDLSSEMIHALLPLYLVGPLGASTALVGFVEGVAESIAAITKVFSGAISDRIARRKPLVLLGYGLAAITKPVFPLASSAWMVVGARFVDRFGKGLRGAPRDALIADLTTPGTRGAAYGMRQSMDTIGAILAPGAAILLMWLYNDFRLVFWIAVIPAFISVLFVVFGVSETDPEPAAKGSRPKLDWRTARRLPRLYFAVLGVAFILTLARFSEAFLVLAAHHAGLVVALAPLVYVAMNIVYSITAALAGSLSDGVDRRAILIAGTLALIVADVFLAMTGSLAAVGLGVLVWGLHMGLTQGLFAALIADIAPSDLRGTAFGLYNLATGLAMLAASLIAGVLWDMSGPTATFLAGAGFTVIALFGMLALPRRAGQTPRT
ncbi:MAG: MFS transporter [Hyphomicrobiales bacterium]